MVSLVRQPQNPYDQNAVMVANVYGSQVGHIKKELAVPMAYIMDNNLARVEGYSSFSVFSTDLLCMLFIANSLQQEVFDLLNRVVPYGETNQFSMPVNLTFWGKEENREAVHNQMRRRGFKLDTEFKGSLICLFAT